MHYWKLPTNAIIESEEIPFRIYCYRTSGTWKLHLYECLKSKRHQVLLWNEYLMRLEPFRHDRSKLALHRAAGVALLATNSDTMFLAMLRDVLGKLNVILCHSPGNTMYLMLLFSLCQMLPKETFNWNLNHSILAWMRSQNATSFSIKNHQSQFHMRYWYISIRDFYFYVLVQAALKWIMVNKFLYFECAISMKTNILPSMELFESGFANSTKYIKFEYDVHARDAVSFALHIVHAWISIYSELSISFFCVFHSFVWFENYLDFSKESSRRKNYMRFSNISIVQWK